RILLRQTLPKCESETKCTLLLSKQIITKLCTQITPLSVKLELHVPRLQTLRKKLKKEQKLLQPKARKKLLKPQPKHNNCFLKISEKHPVNSGCFFYFYRRNR